MVHVYTGPPCIHIYHTEAGILLIDLAPTLAKFLFGDTPSCITPQLYAVVYLRSLRPAAVYVAVSVYILFL